MPTKQSLYFPDEVLREIMSESVRLDRSLSWIVQAAWRVARTELSRSPAVEPAQTAIQDPARRPPLAEDRAPSAQVLEFLRGKFEHPTG